MSQDQKMNKTPNKSFQQGKILKWLTCKDDLKTGPWRALLLISLPFFLYLIVMRKWGQATFMIK